MSEVKGTLLTIILAIAVFSIVFTIITVAINENALTVSDRMQENVEKEPDIVLTHQSQNVYTYGM